MVVSAGCSGEKVATKSSNELVRYKIHSLAVMPFTSIVTPQVRDRGTLFVPAPDRVLRSDISLSIPPDGQLPPKQTVVVPEYAAKKVAELFVGRLRTWSGIQVLASSEVAGASIGDESLWESERPARAAAAAAKRLKVDAVLIGLVSVYQERVGSRWGADPSASVGFDVKVIAADEQVLWVGSYYERQRPMTEDLKGFLQRRAFVTADELAEYGVDEMLKDFPFGQRGNR